MVRLDPILSTIDWQAKMTHVLETEEDGGCDEINGSHKGKVGGSRTGCVGLSGTEPVGI